MSNRRTIVATTSILFLGLFSGYLFYPHNISNSLSKNKSLRPYNEIKIRTHKLHQPFTVELTADTTTPIELNKNFNLKAVITVDANLKNATYSWKVPEGVRYITGNNTGSVNLGVKDTLEINTQFENLTTENKIIFLIISDSTGIIYSEQFHTQEQDKIKADLADLKARQDNYVEEPATPDEQ